MSQLHGQEGAGWECDRAAGILGGGVALFSLHEWTLTHDEG